MIRRRRTAKPLTRRPTRPSPEPPAPQDYATAERPIGICRGCGHHTSAFCGACTVLVPHPEAVLAYCGHDCRLSFADPEETSS